ncbi:class I SAM-dependent methyltransferase [Nocardia pseudobrasiliensis]|uniref:S-adenosyl-L-methionine-dependent methyltransferase n=1 Tax=Nocardia pseudobrasiliensis TaxID=45979 RepID=A0A370ID26_9NOCA|nr:SAM-dependent methyltransferase [Nocardia pseudobrasiliensis]RDI68645.1 methyltransferase (TIGR00027 family) [Nocardia pseudobrasiliensis]
MQTGQPSRTALAAARYRADHQDLEGGNIFRDPLARAIVGETGPDERFTEKWRQRMRGYIAVRARFAEDALAAAAARGTGQVVILGAGLDTFAYRNPHPGLRVFEVDHPDTQTWKCERLARAGIEIPDSVAYVPVDFERDALGASLTAAGLDPECPAFVIWLGVTVYLTRAAIDETLRVLGGLAPDTELVFDYGPPIVPPPTAELRAVHEERERRLAAVGERWISFFTPEQIAEILSGNGFAVAEDLSVVELAGRYVGREVPTTAGPRLIRARVAR